MLKCFELADVKLTLKEKSILDVFHPDAMRLFIVCSDLKRVCWTLWDQRVRLDKEDQVQSSLGKVALHCIKV